MKDEYSAFSNIIGFIVSIIVGLSAAYGYYIFLNPTHMFLKVVIGMISAIFGVFASLAVMEYYDVFKNQEDNESFTGTVKTWND